MPSRIASRTAFESTGTGTREAERGPDPFVPAQEHVQDEPVDRVVAAVERDHATVLRLAVPVHAAFALLVAGRVPGEVVVDDRVEAALEVDPLGQAVRGDEDPTWLVRQSLDARLALLGRKRPGHGLDRDLAELALVGGTRQILAQRFRHVLGRRDVAAEHDRVAAVLRAGPRTRPMPLVSFGSEPSSASASFARSRRRRWVELGGRAVRSATSASAPGTTSDPFVALVLDQVEDVATTQLLDLLGADGVGELRAVPQRLHGRAGDSTRPSEAARAPPTSGSAGAERPRPGPGRSRGRTRAPAPGAADTPA